MGIMDIKYNYKLWLEYKGRPILGKGRYKLLKAIDKSNSLKKASHSVGIANKTAYNYIKKIERRLGKKIIESHKGGKKAGGYTKLNPLGKELIKEFREAEKRLK